MEQKTEEQVVETISAEEAPKMGPSDIEALIKEQFEKVMEARHQKALRKGSVWYQGRKIPMSEWEQLPFEVRLAENNVIKK